MSDLWGILGPRLEGERVSWALFDLDDTLLDHDSFGRFTAYLLRRNPLRAAGAVALLPLVAVLFARRGWRLHAASVLLWLGTVAMSDARLGAVVETYLRGLGVAERLRPRGAEALADHFAAGERVAVVTACAEPLAVPLCRAIDPRIRVVSSSLRRRWGGLVSDRHCHGARKVEMLAEAGVTGPFSAGYGDSVSDAAMLNLARTAVLVNLAKPTEATLRAQLTRPDRVTSAHWPPRAEASSP